MLGQIWNIVRMYWLVRVKIWTITSSELQRAQSFWEADSNPTSENFSIFYGPLSIHEISRLCLILSHVNPVYTLMSYSLMIHLNSIFQSECYKCTRFAALRCINSAVNNPVNKVYTWWNKKTRRLTRTKGGLSTEPFSLMKWWQIQS
jgi:hypothetical protein